MSLFVGAAAGTTPPMSEDMARDRVKDEVIKLVQRGRVRQAMQRLSSLGTAEYGEETATKLKSMQFPVAAPDHIYALDAVAPPSPEYHGVLGRAQAPTREFMRRLASLCAKGCLRVAVAEEPHLRAEKWHVGVLSSSREWRCARHGKGNGCEHSLPPPLPKVTRVTLPPPLSLLQLRGCCRLPFSCWAH
jgi:hypothetical protein